MRDRSVIIAALALFLVILTAPVWYARASGVTARAPELKRPANEKVCVMPVEYMRASHMDLLMTWREDVVRRQVRIHEGPDGTLYPMSLSRTCLRCHANKAEFCDRCHSFANVTPYCWDCHVDPALTKGSGK